MNKIQTEFKQAFLDNKEFQENRNVIVTQVLPLSKNNVMDMQPFKNPKCGMILDVVFSKVDNYAVKRIIVIFCSIEILVQIDDKCFYFSNDYDHIVEWFLTYTD